MRGLLLTGLLLVGGAAAAHPTGYPHRHVRSYGYQQAEAPADEVRAHLGFSGFATAVLGQSGGPELIAAGGGASVFGGLRLGPRLGLELGWTGSFHNGSPVYEQSGYYIGTSYLALNGITMDALLHLPSRSRVDPFLQAGAGYWFLGREGSGADWSGPGLDAGAGLDIWLSPFLTLGPRGLYRYARLAPNFTAEDRVTHLSALTLELRLAAHF